ncbi:MAG: exodeoxyribonuclease VII large subunit [Planctomycetota bacterium]
MGRLPFDPEKMAISKRGQVPRVDSAPERATLTVGQLAGRIDAALRSGVPSSVHVVGEVGRATHRTHWYFTLKDEDASIDAVLFSRAAARSPSTPVVGERVLVRGRVEFYAPTGRTSLIVDRLEPAGEGALQKRLRELVDRLRSEGLLDEAKKRPLPVFPRRIAVITSATGAALQDVLDTVRRRCPSIGVVQVDARVQGERAADEVRRAVLAVGENAARLRVDAILVTRGGGSMEDLWSFNDEALARAVSTCPVPVVAAIGHETDTTLIELVADVRAATPTQAAMRLTPDREALLRETISARGVLSSAIARRVAGSRAELERVTATPALRDPLAPVRLRGTRLDRASLRLRSAIREHATDGARRLDRAVRAIEAYRPPERHASEGRRIDRAEARLHAALRERLRHEHSLVGERSARLSRVVTRATGARRTRLTHATSELRAVSPERVLERGYTWTTLRDGTLVRAPGDAGPGSVLVTRTAGGDLRSRVEGGAKRGAEPEPDAPGLFGDADDASAGT